MKNISPQLIISLITTCGFFGCVFWILKFGFAPEGKDILNIMVGVLGTVWVSQMGYFFNSTSSSKAKDDTISNLAQGAPADPLKP